MQSTTPDFSGWATKNNILCTDGHTIRQGAFAKDDGKTVPLVWRHQRDEIPHILGHATLKYTPEGIRTDAFFNESKEAQDVKLRVQHGDLNQLSIFANRLIKNGMDVLDGSIGEVSVVPIGANEGAFIDFVSLNHEYDASDVWVGSENHNAMIYSGEELEINHEGDSMDEDLDDTIEDIYNSMTDEQKAVVEYVAKLALESKLEQSAEGEEDEAKPKSDSEEDMVNSDEDETKTKSNEDKTKTKSNEDEADEAESDEEKKKTLSHERGSMPIHDTFESNGPVTNPAGTTLTHEQVQTIVRFADRRGSLRDAVLEHAGTYGIDNIDMLFPEAKIIGDMPDLVKRRTDWVEAVLGGVHHNPFSRIKTISADLTYDTARAKGYVTGTLKKEEFFGLQNRITTPTTVYKKQKLDRDDILDIQDFDVIVFLKQEMRIMLDEELARAILLGDGRAIDDKDKITEPLGLAEGKGIRSILNDHTFYASDYVIDVDVPDEDVPEEIVRALLAYEGSGNPTFFASRLQIANMSLLKSELGNRLYPTMENLTSALQVGRIVGVDLMKGLEKTITTPDGDKVCELVGIAVNLADYSVGTDKGGEVTFFDDFDLNFNQELYLLESRISGALRKWRSAVRIWKVKA